MTDTNKALTEGWLVGTKQLQIRSVVEFAASLGYYYDTLRNSFFFDGHLSDVTFKSCEIISFTKMVFLHNSVWVQNHKPNTWIPYPGGVHTAISGQPLKIDHESCFELDTYSFVKASASKLVAIAYLNGDRKVSCYRHQVQMMVGGYYEQFLEPLIDAEGEQ